MLQLVLVHRRGDDGVRQAPEVGNVEGAVVRLAVLADDAGAVGDERDGQVLQADVVDDLVERPLEEGRVDRDERR